MEFCLHDLIFFLAYSTFYILGLIFSMQVPFVGFQPIRTSEHMAAAGMTFIFLSPIRKFDKIFVLGIFGLVNAYAFLQFLQGYLTRREFRYIFVAAISIALVAGFCGVVLLTYLGKVLVFLFIK
jgi:dolichyl-diphosphooligosaccharide--protein glycosyltransferase